MQSTPMMDEALRDKLGKLAAMALDQGGDENEKNVAAQHFFRMARKACVRPSQLFAVEVVVEMPPPAACRVRMPFGKHRGLTLAQIQETSPGYLEWCVENVSNMAPHMRESMQVVIDHYST